MVSPTEPVAISEEHERLGRAVRDAWVGWARSLCDPKPSWLVPWEELDYDQQIADVMIGISLYGLGFREGYATAAHPTGRVPVGPPVTTPAPPASVQAATFTASSGVFVPATDTETPDGEICEICGAVVLQMTFRGKGVCGEEHRKQRVRGARSA